MAYRTEGYCGCCCVTIQTMATCSLDGCHRRCFERAGIVHDYCGRTHAKEAVDRGMLHDLAPPHGNCHVR